MQELKQDIKEIKEELKGVSATLVRNTVSLELHEKRTSLAENRLERLEVWLLGLLASILVATIIKLII